MRIITAILVFIALTGCASTLMKHVDGVKAVKLGDTYDEMVEKIGDVPSDFKCYESRTRQHCTAYYYYGGAYIFRFENSNVITSISR